MVVCGKATTGLAMKDIYEIVVNPFKDPNIGLDKWYAFTTDHIERMRSNNPAGIFTTRLQATAAALEVLKGGSVEHNLQFGERKASKLRKKAFRKSLAASIGKIHAAVIGTYGPR